MKNGYTMPYYPMRGSSDRLSIASASSPSPSGSISRKSSSPPCRPRKMTAWRMARARSSPSSRFPATPRFYATPIGAIQGNNEVYYCDILFYYDDPHTIYDNWPKEVWTAIDAHQVKPGMSELETRMSIGSNAIGRRNRGRPHCNLRPGRQAVDHHLRQQPRHYHPKRPPPAAQPAAQAKP